MVDTQRMTQTQHKLDIITTNVKRYTMSRNRTNDFNMWQKPIVNANSYSWQRLQDLNQELLFNLLNTLNGN